MLQLPSQPLVQKPLVVLPVVLHQQALAQAQVPLLVLVVNPQSFHWSMDLLLPWGRLALLCAAVGVAGALTAGFSARAAAGRDMVRAVKEDW